MTDREVLELAEKLCERMANVLGYRTARGEAGLSVPFHQSKHPRRRLIWELAKVAFEELHQTDIDDIVTNCETEDEPFFADGI